MSRRNRGNRQKTNVNTLEQAYAQHVRQFPQLHLPNIITGQASEQDLKTDFTVWVGGTMAAHRYPRILSEVSRLSSSIGSHKGTGQGSLFSFIGQTTETKMGQAPSLSSLTGGESRRGGERTTSLDQVMQNIVSDYSRVRRVA